MTRAANTRARTISVALGVISSLALVTSAPLAGSIALAGDAPTPTGWVAQIGTYDYLVQPDYDGLAPVSAASRGTTVGLGTFDRLDGELVLVGGTAYRVGTDGVPKAVALTRTTPFFEAVRFTPQASMRLPAGTECSALLPLVDQLAGTTQGMVAVRLIGTFTVLTARSVPAQEQPYPPLADVVAQQTVFPLSDVPATLVGFRTGSNLLGIGAPGLHLHGLTKKRDAGGHILGCTASGDVRLTVHVTRGVHVLGN